MNRPLLTNFVTVGSGTALHGLTLDSRDSRFSGRLPLVLAGHVVKHSQSDHIKKNLVASVPTKLQSGPKGLAL